MTRDRLPRRQFLHAAGALGTRVALSLPAVAQPPSQQNKQGEPEPDRGTGEIPRRRFGRHDVRVSALALGGHHIGDINGVEQAIRLMHEAMDAGITFFDNCWEYHNGKSENWMGRALKGRRDKVFLMTKVCTHGRDAELAMKMLEESLRRLGTDHLDLWQVHGVSFDNDPDLAYRDGGVLDALDLAKRQGKTRFVGFSGHKHPGVHLRMVELGYPFDSVQMPLNCFDANFRSFEKHVLPEANRRGIAVLGMKSMGGTAAGIKKGVVKAEKMLRYAMSLPVATTISGMDSLDVLHQNLRVARGFKPYSNEEMEALRKRCATTAADGRFEMYKLSLKFDNPEARKPHDFPLDRQQKEVREMLAETESA
jgi:aryl-alcohol dehydrogenase-like predicted oxidoreductase